MNIRRKKRFKDWQNKKQHDEEVKTMWIEIEMKAFRKMNVRNSHLMWEMRNKQKEKYETDCIYTHTHMALCYICSRIKSLQLNVSRLFMLLHRWRSNALVVFASLNVVSMQMFSHQFLFFYYFFFLGKMQDSDRANKAEMHKNFHLKPK